MIENGKVTFTAEEQAEVNNIVEARIARERQKYNDYDVLKSTVADLTKYKVETEAGFEVKVTQAVSAKEAELKNLYEGQINSIKAEKVMTDFLGSKDIKLPEAYRKMIEVSSDPAKLEASYKKVVETFKADMKAMGITKPMGSPSTPPSHTITKKFDKMTIDEKNELYQKDADLYRKLRDNSK